MNFTDIDLELERFLETLKNVRGALERFSDNLSEANNVSETPIRESGSKPSEPVIRKSSPARGASSSFDDTAAPAAAAAAASTVDDDGASSVTEPPMSAEEFREKVNDQFLRTDVGKVAARTRPLLDKYAGEGLGMRAIAPERYAAFIAELTALTDSLVAGGDS